MLTRSLFFATPPHVVCILARFLCGTVNEFVAEVGKAYERATENKEEADAMAKKVNGFSVCNRIHCVTACVTVTSGQRRCVCVCVRII